MAIRTLPTAPRRTDDPDTFIANTDAWLTAIPLWTDDVNATAANLNSIAAGGAFALSMKWSTNTTTAAVANGVVKVDNATVNSAVTIYLSINNLGGQPINGLVQGWGGSTNGVKGQVRISSLDGSRYVIYNIISAATNSAPNGYNSFSIQFASTPAGYPFSDNESVMVFFQRTGDKGDPPTNTQFTPVDMAAGTSVNLSAGNYFLKTMSADTTLTFTAPPSQGYSFTIELTHTAGTLTLPANVTTANASPLTLTAGKTHLLSFFTSSTGSKWRMASSVNYTT